MSTMHPGATLKNLLKNWKVSQVELAKAMAVSEATVSRLVAQKSDLTADIAVRLSVVTGLPDQYWMSQQAAYNLAKAKESVDLANLTALPVLELDKRAA